MQITINQILTNGMIDTLQTDPRIAGFIIGALDSGWMVSKTGAFIAKLNKVRIMVHGNGKEVFFFLQSKGEILKVPFDGFQWSDLEVTRGNLFYKTKFITKTSADYGDRH
jgi:hypothetical protein